MQTPYAVTETQRHYLASQFVSSPQLFLFTLTISGFKWLFLIAIFGDKFTELCTPFIRSYRWLYRLVLLEHIHSHFGLHVGFHTEQDPKLVPIDCQPCAICTSCWFKRTLKDVGLTLNPNMNYCQTLRSHLSANWPVLVKSFWVLISAPCWNQHVFPKRGPSVSSELPYAELPELPTLEFEMLQEVVEPFFQYYASIAAAKPKRLTGCVHIKGALRSTILSANNSLSFSQCQF